MPIEDILRARAGEWLMVVRELAGYADVLRLRLGRLSMALFGSYARGDFNLWSDVDVIVVSEAFEGKPFEARCLALLDAPPRIEAVCWAPGEAVRMLGKPWWREALRGCVSIVDDYGLFNECKRVGELLKRLEG